MEPTCLYCKNIAGCPLLSDAKGTYVPERVITSSNFRECSDWEPINSMQSEVRKSLSGIQGDNTFRILHRIGTIINEEDGDEMIEDMPDFAGILREGMSAADREEQLRYETDEEGNVILEEVEGAEPFKRPRPTYQLRKFACDPEGYVKLDHSAGMFQTQDWLIRHILKIEIENGLITKTKKTKTPAQERAKKEEKDMAVGRKVLTRKGKGGKAGGDAPKGPKGPKPSGTGVRKPPKKPGATRDAGDEAPTSLPDVPAFDAEALVEELQVKIGETVQAAVAEKFDEVMAQVEKARSDLMDAITIFHDLMIQTGGTMQYENEEGEAEGLTEMFDNENRILGHLGDEDPS